MATGNFTRLNSKNYKVLNGNYSDEHDLNLMYDSLYDDLREALDYNVTWVKEYGSYGRTEYLEVCRVSSENVSIGVILIAGHYKGATLDFIIYENRLESEYEQVVEDVFQALEGYYDVYNVIARASNGETIYEKEVN